MPMDIPTIQVTEPEITSFSILGFGEDTPITIEPGASAIAPVIIPARVSPNIDASNLDAYGPGSVDYTVIGAAFVAAQDLPETPIEIDPKTYIDNYGIIHVGKSNITTPNMFRAIAITFTATYHYINPSTGDAVTRDLGTFRFIPMRANINAVQNGWTAIQYQPQPGTNG